MGSSSNGLSIFIWFYSLLREIDFWNRQISIVWNCFVCCSKVRCVDSIFFGGVLFFSLVLRFVYILSQQFLDQIELVDN